MALRIPQSGLLLALLIGSASVQAQTTFAEISERVGITGDQCSWGGAWADYDGDGDLDLFTHTHIQTPLELFYGLITRDHLYRNDGGQFTEVTEAMGVKAAASDPHGAAWGDFDNDGDADLLVSHGTPKTSGKVDYNEFYRNDAGLAMVDIAIANGLTGVGVHGRGAAWADYDLDGRLDLYYAGEVKQEDKSALYRQNPDGTFTDVATAAGVARNGQQTFSVAWHDIDLDGYPDLTVSAENASPTLTVYRNRGDGSFESHNDALGLTSLPRIFAFAWGDYDNDGDPDLAVQGADSQGAKLYRNDRGRLRDITRAAALVFPVVGRGLSWGDFDNDGDLDLYLTAYSHPGDRDALFSNNGNGTFTRVGRTTGIGGLNREAKAMDMSFVDYDNDGALDIFGSYGSDCGTGSKLAPFVLYRNLGTTGNWLKLGLRGTVSNRDGLGARVKLLAGGKTQTRQHAGPSHFTSQDSQPVHFGLGTSSQADSIEIIWPSGRTSLLSNVPANTLIWVDEP